MSQFTLDYTNQRQTAVHAQTSKRGHIRLFLGWAAISPLVILGLAASLYQYRVDHKRLYHQHQMYVLRYDSLLAAKQEADRQLVNLLRKRGKAIESYDLKSKR